jgi:UDP-N-acetyl-D-glucosamine dehydrogenase
VVYHDPFVPHLHEDGIDLASVDLNADTVAKADCVVIATDHTDLDWDLLATSKRVVDTRNALKSRVAK